MAQALSQAQIEAQGQNRFQPGVSGNRKGHRIHADRCDAMLADLLRETGEMSVADMALAARAIRLLVVQPRSRIEARRDLKTANRVLSQLRGKYAQPKSPSFVELSKLPDRRHGR